MLNKDRRITLRIIGNPADGEDVKLNIFIDKLEAFKNALINTERLVSGSDRASVYYRIVSASRKSPLTITLEATAIRPKNLTKKYKDLSGPTVQAFFSNLNAIKKKRKLIRIDKPALQSYLKLADKFGEEVFGIDIQNGKRERIKVDTEFQKNVVEFLGKEEVVFGSVIGRAEAFNMHDNSIFYIYPSVGPTRIVCRFPTEMQLEAKGALLKYVRVSGMMKYRPADSFPYEIEVSKIDALDDEKDIPTLMSLRGIITEVTKEKSETLIRKIRDAW